MSDVRVRQARLDDHDEVAAFTRHTWPDRDLEDYIPDAFPDWVESDGDDQRTLVATVDARVCGICQGVLLSRDEAWFQGIRVHPDYRDRDVGRRMTERLLGWSRDRGATVARNMVFAWNGAGLGQSRATGFDPATEIRYVHPAPDASATPGDRGPDDVEVVAEPDTAWRYWTHSDARAHLSGLAADDEESWALRELRPDDLERAAADGGALAVRTGGGTVGMAVRSRTDTRTAGDGDETEDTVAVYGAAAWDDRPAAAALFEAIRADAASIGAERTKVLVPETVRYVSDAAGCRVEIHDEPDFVLAADLAGER